MRTGLLLFAHGARDPNWALPFEAVAEQVRAQAEGLQVVLAFLEFMSPDLVVAARGLVQRGCRRIDVVPLFLGAGGHVRKDLPVLLDQMRAEHPDVDWRLRPAVGESTEVVNAMAATALRWTRDDAAESGGSSDAATRPSSR